MDLIKLIIIIIYSFRIWAGFGHLLSITSNITSGVYMFTDTTLAGILRGDIFRVIMHSL
jgi:hypothetical protein